MTIVYVIFELFLGSVGSIALAGLMFLLNKEKLEKVSTHLMYLAGGKLIGAAFSVSSFLYIALADLIPERHKKTTFKDSLKQLLLINYTGNSDYLCEYIF